MLITIVPLLVALAGALVYALASNGKLQELGRIMFFCGLLVLVAALGGKTVRLF